VLEGRGFLHGEFFALYYACTIDYSTRGATEHHITGRFVTGRWSTPLQVGGTVLLLCLRFFVQYVQDGNCTGTRDFPTTMIPHIANCQNIEAQANFFYFFALKVIRQQLCS